MISGTDRYSRLGILYLLYIDMVVVAAMTGVDGQSTVTVGEVEVERAMKDERKSPRV